MIWCGLPKKRDKEVRYYQEPMSRFWPRLYPALPFLVDPGIDAVNIEYSCHSERSGA